MMLDGKRILITGAARGIGLAAAQEFTAQGARVAIADLDASAAAEAAACIGQSHAVSLEADVADNASVAMMISGAVAALGGLDGMFNNAGIVHPEDHDLVETPLAAWERTLAVNLTGVFLCCRHGIPAILASGGGAIVNNASIVGVVGSYPSQVAYTAAKGGVIALTRELGVAYARRGVRVNAVSPGVTLTPMAAQMMTGDEEAARQDRLRHIPIGRYAEPLEIARVAAFLLSDAASYVTAQNWPVDGGLTEAYLCPPFKAGA